MTRYVQYGCGLTAPQQWHNYDSSPTLRIQRIPVVGRLLRRKLNVIFPDNVMVGDIVKGLPESPDSCQGVFCSHVLEHLSLADFRTALKNTLLILKPGGKFRVVVPDLEFLARHYLKLTAEADPRASFVFMESSLLGASSRPRGLKSQLTQLLGASHHLWMWDHASMILELQKAGFKSIRICKFHDSDDPMFKFVEDENRFTFAVAIECTK